MSKDDTLAKMAYEAYCDAQMAHRVQIAHRVQTVLKAHTGIRAFESAPDWIDLPSEIRVAWEEFAWSIGHPEEKELRAADAFKAAVAAYLEKGFKYEF